MVRAVSYERVSVDKRDARRSVGEQRADNLAVADREGWQVVETFRDNDRSASRFATKPRPAFVALVAAVKAGRVDVVIAWEASRLSRKLGEFVDFRDACARRGVLWSIGGRTYDPADERDTLPLIMQACEAESDSARTSKRVLRAVTATAEAGRPHGRMTYGYRREYDPATKAFLRQVIDDGQAAVLREIADRFLAGESFFAIARDLTSRGVPAPAGGAVWYPTNCTRLMRNPAYAGRRMRNGQYVADAVWPPMFDDRTWSAMQAKLSDPDRSTRKESAVRHLLTGLAVCGACDRPTIGSMKQRGGYRAYMCVKCFGVARREDLVDKHVNGKIVERLAAPDVADLFGQADRDDDAAQRARELAASLRVRYAEFEAEALAGRLSAASWSRIEANLSAQIDAADLDAQRAVMPEPVRHLAGVAPDRVAAVWGVLTTVERREALRAMGAVVTILRTGSGRRVFDPESVTVEFHPQP